MSSQIEFKKSIEFNRILEVPCTRKLYPFLKSIQNNRLDFKFYAYISLTTQVMIDLVE